MEGSPLKIVVTQPEIIESYEKIKIKWTAEAVENDLKLIVYLTERRG